MNWGVRDCLPKQRTLATPEGAARFAEAWAIRWDAEIRQIVANKNKGYEVVLSSPQASAAAASRDFARRRGGRKDWWKAEA